MTRHDPRSIDSRLVADMASASELAVSLLSSTADCVKVLALDGRLDQMSYAGMCAMEIDDFSTVRGHPWWDLWPDESRERLRAAVAEAGGGASTRLTAFCPTAKGNPRWWDVSVSPVRDESGRVSGVLSVSRDVTDHVEARRDAEAALSRAALLLREIDHRVKNSLMLIVSLLRIQTRQLSDPAAVRALDEAASRVGTVARVHERLYMSDTPSVVALDDYLRHLCGDLEAAFRGADRPIRLALDPLVTSPDVAVALGLAAAELVSNAHRHARPGGALDIAVGLARDAEGRGVLTVEDDGPGLPEDFAPEASTGVGMRVILAKAAEVRGRLTHGRSAMGGARFDFAFDLARGGADARSG